MFWFSAVWKLSLLKWEADLESLRDISNLYIFWMDHNDLFGFCCWNSLGTNFSHFLSQENLAVEISMGIIL